NSTSATWNPPPTPCPCSTSPAPTRRVRRCRTKKRCATRRVRPAASLWCRKSSSDPLFKPVQAVSSMLNQLTISELGATLRRRKGPPGNITQACLDRIAAVDSRTHAFISHDAVDALAQADAADKLLAQGGNAGRPLLGIPIAIKDVLAAKHQPLNCAS